MTASDVVDGLLYAKLPDGRVLQVCLSQAQVRAVIYYAGELRGELMLLDQESGISWTREEKPNKANQRRTRKKARVSIAKRSFGACASR
jgi:hypothetical protein